MEESTVRISCASLCRIQIENRYLVMINKNRREKGIYQLSPVGGGIEIRDWSVLSHLTFTPEKSTSNDLRLFLNVNQIGQFSEWFYTRQHRETTPFRELREELVDESGALFDLHRDDVGIRFLHIVEDTKQTLRRGLTGQFTHYFFEIFDVTFRTPDSILRLKSAPANSGVVLLDEEIARQGGTVQMMLDGDMRTATIATEYLFHDKPADDLL